MPTLREVVFSLGLIPLLTPTVAEAIAINFVPAEQRTTLDTLVSVALVISDIGHQTSPSVSTFDVDVSFRSDILTFVDATFGDPTLGDQLDLHGLGNNPSSEHVPNPGVVNLFELSLDTPSDLDMLQAGSFILAIVSFRTSMETLGTSPLILTINELGGVNGERLSATSGSGQIVVASVDESSTLGLLGTALLLIGAARLSCRLICRGTYTQKP